MSLIVKQTSRLSTKVSGGATYPLVPACDLRSVSGQQEGRPKRSTESRGTSPGVHLVAGPSAVPTAPRGELRMGLTTPHRRPIYCDPSTGRVFAPLPRSRSVPPTPWVLPPPAPTPPWGTVNPRDLGGIPEETDGGPPFTPTPHKLHTEIAAPTSPVMVMTDWIQEELLRSQESTKHQENPGHSQ